MKRVWIKSMFVASILLFGILGCSNSKSTADGSLSALTTASSVSSSASTRSVNSSSTTSLPATDENKLVNAASVDPSTKPHHPTNGTTERKAILDAMRPDVENDIGPKVVFEVNAINVKDGFAFVDAIPRRPSGAKIDYSKTGYRELIKEEHFDGGNDANIYALLKQKDGRWRLLTYVIGPTDVAYAGWWWTYSAPKAIFPSTE